MNRILAKLEVNPKDKGLLGAVNFAFFINGAMVIMLGVLLPYIKAENSFSYTQAGMLLSAHQVGTFAAVLAAGVLPYAIGRKKSTLIMGAGAIIGMALIVVLQNVFLLIFAFALTGIGRGTLNNVCNLTASNIAGNRTAAINVLHSGFALGALIAPVIVFAYVFAAGVSGWKLAALTIAVLMAAVLMFIMRSNLPNLPPKNKGGVSLSFLKEKSFWIPTMLLFFYIAVEASIIGWFVLYFADAGTLPGGFAGFVPTMHWLMMMVGRICIATVSNRIHNKNRALLIMSMLTIVCFTGMLLSTSALLNVIFLLGIGLSMAGIYPTTMATAGSTITSVSLGFLIAISGLGAIFMPAIIGVVADARGLTEAITLLLVALFIMMLLVVAKTANDK